MSTVILHIDEHPELPDGVSDTLAREGYTLLQTADPEEAIRLTETHSPSLVISEIVFSGCDGPDLLSAICNPDGANCPVLVLTKAPNDSQMQAEAIALGTRDFFTKPVLASELLEAIRTVAPAPWPSSPQPKPERAKPRPDSAGNLADKAMPELLARLHRRGASGALTVRHGKVRMGVQLRNGSVVALASKKRGAPSRDLNALSEASAAAEMEARAESELFATFTWTDGSYRFDDRHRIKSSSLLPIARDTPDLLLIGAIEACGEDQALSWLNRHRTLYALSATPLHELCDLVELTPPQQEALSKLSGDGTLDDLQQSQLFEARVLYGLCISGSIDLQTEPLITLTEEFSNTERSHDAPRQQESEPVLELEEEISSDQTIEAPPERTDPSELFAETVAQDDGEASDATVGAESEELESSEEVSTAEEPDSDDPQQERSNVYVVAGGHVERLEVASPTRGEAARSPALPGEVKPSADATSAAEVALRELAERMVGDDFLVLDLEPSATDDEVHAAYERALEEIPDPKRVAADAELRELEVGIRARIEAAYEHLKDASTRRGHVELLEEKEQDEVEQSAADRALEAESWFRKGKGFLTGKKYDEASEAFGMATHLDPDEGDYLSHLGYSLFLTNPKNQIVQREAMEQIAKGIKASPDRELSYVYLGRILQQKGDIETARKVFKRAVQISPDCHTALQALRVLELREDKSKGLLSKLMKR